MHTIHAYFITVLYTNTIPYKRITVVQELINNNRNNSKQHNVPL